MASLADIIKQQVAGAAGAVEIPANVKNTVLNGLAESVLGGFTQTATKAGGIDAITKLLTGKQAAASSPVTDLASKLFLNNILKNLNLGTLLNGKLTALIPTIIGKVSGLIKDQDGDGDVDLNDILIALKGGGAQKQTANAGNILGAATSVLGKILGK